MEALARDGLFAPPSLESLEQAMEYGLSLGAGRVLLGSDYPHPEGFPEPRKFFEGAGLTADERRLIEHDNAAALLRLGA